MKWTDFDWIPVDRSLPTPQDGPAIASGAKIAVRVLTVDMMLNGKDPEIRGFHLQARSFDDDDEGRQRVMFWAPSLEASDLDWHAGAVPPIPLVQ